MVTEGRFVANNVKPALLTLFVKVNFQAVVIRFGLDSHTLPNSETPFAFSERLFLRISFSFEANFVIRSSHLRGRYGIIIIGTHFCNAEKFIG